MITIVNQTVKVVFGKEGKGTILIGSSRSILEFKVLKKPCKIGKKRNDYEVSGLPNVILEFNDPKSIDVLIEHLHRIKTQMEIDRFPLAC